MRKETEFRIVGHRSIVGPAILRNLSPRGCRNIVRHTHDDRKFTELLRGVVRYSGNINHDDSIPDGMPPKLSGMGQSARLGRRPKTCLRNGVVPAYEDDLHDKV